MYLLKQQNQQLLIISIRLLVGRYRRDLIAPKKALLICTKHEDKNRTTLIKFMRIVKGVFVYFRRDKSGKRMDENEFNFLVGA